MAQPHRINNPEIDSYNYAAQLIFDKDTKIIQ